MVVFLERFILGLCVAAVGLIVVNPFTFDTNQRLAALIVVVGVAYFAAATITRRTNEKAAISAKPTSEARTVAAPAAPALGEPVASPKRSLKGKHSSPSG